MKKLVFLALLISLLVSLLVGCTSLKHEDIFGDWEYDNVYHWKPFIECTWDRCKVDIAVTRHNDEDGDHLCDVCRGSIGHEHFEIGMHSDESGHYAEVVCTWDACEIDHETIPHFDTDSDSYCDDCGYIMQSIASAQ